MSKMPFKRGDIVRGYGDVGIVTEANEDVVWIEFPYPCNWTRAGERGCPFSRSFDYQFKKVGEIDPPTED